MLHVLTRAFPTRRSSELSAARRTGRPGARRAVDGLAGDRTQPIVGLCVPRIGAQESGFPGPAAHRRRGRGLERKDGVTRRSEEHTSELQSLMRTSYAVFCSQKKKKKTQTNTHTQS